MTAVTLSPRRVCSATVPPQPRISSSGWAAMTSTVSDMVRTVPPDPASPCRLTQRASAEDAPVFGLDFEQRHRALTAGHQLAARFIGRADDGAQAGARLRDRQSVERRQRGAPNLPAPALEVPERAGVGPRQRAHEVVDAIAGAMPVDQAVGRTPPRQHRLA